MESLCLKASFIVKSFVRIRSNIPDPVLTCEFEFTFRLLLVFYSYPKTDTLGLQSIKASVPLHPCIHVTFSKTLERRYSLCPYYDHAIDTVHENGINVTYIRTHIVDSKSSV